VSYRAWCQCIDPACANTRPRGEVVYHCARCGNLLELQHDVDARVPSREPAK